MNQIIIIGLLAVLSCIGLAVLITRAKRGGNTRRVRLANIAGGTHEKGITKLTDAAITTRHLLVTKGTDNDHIAVAGAADIPFGTCPDEAPAAESNVNVLLLGKGSTHRMIANAAMVTIGVRVYAAASGKIALTGTVEVGLLLTVAGADGDIVEVSDYPPPSAPGVSSTNPVIIGQIVTTGLTASGSASNDFSGSTGTFKTSSGLTTISGGLITATSSRSGPGAVALTAALCKLTSTGVADALTLANGTDGQELAIIHEVDGGSAVLTPTTKTGFSTITFTNAGDSCVLKYVTTRGWMIAALNGAVAA